MQPGVLEDAYLRHAIGTLRSDRELDRFGAIVDQAGALDRVVTKLGDTASGALVHFVCEPEVRVAYLEHVIARVDVNQPLPQALVVLVPIRWGVTPSVRLRAGSTPLDLVETILAFVTTAEASHASKPNDQHRADTAAMIRTLAEAKRELLLARGAMRGAATDVLDLPPILAETATQLLRLATLIGADAAAIRAAVGTLDAGGMGPWGFLHEVVSRFEQELVSPALTSPALARLLAAFTTDAWSNQLDRSDLPAARRASASLAIEFATDDDARMLAVKTDRGTEIWQLAGDTVTVVAPSVPAYLEAEIDRWQR
ncbi:MAG: hypothetical protein NT062_23635 [Proteobacteria bacterium]|nr:hypothetical protein [Pseudomonadota bacterium]